MRPVLRFVQISDLHVTGRPGERVHGADTEAIVRRAVPLLDRLRPDFVVATGDLSADGSQASYERLRELLQPLRAPLHVCPGNHDDRERLRRAFALDGADGPLHEAFDVAGHRFVLLDSAQPGKEDGWLSPEELAWLEGELAASPTTPTWLFVHHHPLPVYVRWLDRLGLQNGGALLRVLARHPQVRAVGYGHVHLPRRWRYRGVLFVSVPALAFQVSPLSQEPEITLDPPGFRLVEVADGEIRDWLHFLDGHVVREPSPGATPLYIRAPENDAAALTRAAGQD
jgi:3',5'-cyclic AMP phosphodiesterase CpdA